MENDIRWEIKAKYGDLRSSEQTVADWMLQHFGEMKGSSLKDVASFCKVSQPTVLRMIRAIGFDGWKDFYVAVIGELATAGVEHTSQPMYGYSLNENDRLEDIPGKIVATTIRTMEDNLKSISVQTFQKVIEAIGNARFIDIYSVENSNVTAKDLQTKLLYLGLSCRYMEDNYHQRIGAGSLTSEDVAIGISYSGCSKDTVEVMKMARKSGATTIVLTNFKDSVISQYADLLMCTSQEQLFYGDAIFSRTTQLLLVDMIYMGLLVYDYPRFSKKLDQNSQVIGDKAYQTL